ncbi:MAG TPA: response regulator [bacterium]
MRILLVEDEAQIRELVQTFLAAEGHQVAVGGNGQQGWDRFSEDPAGFDLVIADMKMPVLDGMGLLGRLRMEGHRVPFILMTGHAELNAESGDVPPGVYVMHKPFELDDMLLLVAQVGTKR